jgi:aspartokinase
LADNLETTATYWEARIKTYGFHRVTDLCLFELAVDNLKISLLGHALCRMGEEGIPLVLTFSQIASQGLSACFVVPRLFEGRVLNGLQEAADLGDGVVRQVLPVEVVFFYGPHFGDRYGIAVAALQSLAGGGIHTTAAACSGSCVYLVLPEGRSEEAVRVLSEVFEIPGASLQKSSGVNQA